LLLLALPLGGQLLEAQHRIPGPPPNLESGVLQALNRLRQDPAAWSNSLSAERRYFRGRLFSPPGEIPLQTQEGRSAVEEAIAALRSVRTPLEPLLPAAGLARAARLHVQDTGPRGLLGHEGSNGSNFNQRISRFGEWSGGISECISYGDGSGADIISQLVIDDGVPERGHRKTLLDPRWRVVGIACGPHTGYHNMCVLDFASEFRPR